MPALLAQCRRFALLPPDTSLGGQGTAQSYAGQVGQWSPACTAAQSLPPADSDAARHYIETWFQPYRVTAPGLVTGYYEPELRGARERFGAFQVPLLARPADLVETPPPATDPNGQKQHGRLLNGRLVPYWTRAEIEAGAAGNAAPLLFLADPIDLFVLQIQGSGRVRLPDGTVVQVGFDGRNGRPYTPIGRVLVQQGALAADKVSLQSIRDWLEAHPAQAKAVMDRNENYVFFRELPATPESSGPPGALGLNLAPNRTAAVDRHYLPLGTPIFIDTTDPVAATPWRHLVLAQDLGTDIVGPARLDLFLGWGLAAEQRAGRLREPGTVYLLLPHLVK